MVRSTSSLDDRRSAILGDVGRLARDTAHKVRETVWVVNTRYDTLPKLVGHMHDTADTLLSGQSSTPSRTRGVPRPARVDGVERTSTCSSRKR